MPDRLSDERIAELERLLVLATEGPYPLHKSERWKIRERATALIAERTALLAERERLRDENERLRDDRKPGTDGRADDTCVEGARPNVSPCPHVAEGAPDA